MLHKTNKKAVSLMIAYIMIISIGVAISVIVYAWLKAEAESYETPTDCDFGTSIILEDFFVDGVPNANFDIKNNGRFRIHGVVVTVSTSENDDPNTQLNNTQNPSVVGMYEFVGGLDPGDTQTASYENDIGNGNPLLGGLGNIKVVRIQPFIDYSGTKVMCSDEAIILEKV